MPYDANLVRMVGRSWKSDLTALVLDLRLGSGGAMGYPVAVYT